MNVLVFTKDQNPYAVKDYLEAEFPDLNVVAGKEADEVGDFFEKADVLVTLRLPDELMARCKNVKWIQLLITGTNYIEELPTFQARKDIILTSMRGIHGPQMSEMAIMFMIAMSRQLPKFIHNKDKKLWDRWPTTLLWNKKLAILGIGVIGEAIATRAKAFGMTVIGVDPFYRKVDAIDEFVGLDKLMDVAAEADYFVCVAPSTPDNHGLLNADFFNAMKPTAYFVNQGRGEVVDEPALIQALKDRKIAGAALDTFWNEPLEQESPLWDLDNVIITPHVGGMCDVYIQQTAPTVIENVKRYLAGERKNLINFIPRS